MHIIYPCCSPSDSSNEPQLIVRYRLILRHCLNVLYYLRQHCSIKVWFADTVHFLKDFSEKKKLFCTFFSHDFEMCQTKKYWNINLLNFRQPFFSNEGGGDHLGCWARIPWFLCNNRVFLMKNKNKRDFLLKFLQNVWIFKRITFSARFFSESDWIDALPPRGFAFHQPGDPNTFHGPDQRKY